MAHQRIDRRIDLLLAACVPTPSESVTVERLRGAASADPCCELREDAVREATARAAESKLVQRASSSLLLARDSKLVAGVATGLRSAKARVLQQAQQRAAGKMDQPKRRAAEEETPSPEPSPEPSPGQTQAEAAAAAPAPAPPPAPPAAHAAAAASGKPPAGTGKGKGDGKLKDNRLHDVDDDDDDDDEDGGFVYERAATNGPPAVAAPGSGPIRRTVGVVQSNER